MIKKYALIMTVMASVASLTSAFGLQDFCCPQTSYCCEDSPGRFFVRGDLLYWKPHASGLELAFGNSAIVENIVDGVQILSTTESDKTPKFDWDAGYRVAVGYDFASSNWQVGACWTHFQSDSSRKDREDDIESRGRCKIKLEQLDVLIAYKATFGECNNFNVKPFIGVRAVKINEDLRARPITAITLFPDIPVTETRNFEDDQNLRGIGPVLGFQGNWDIGAGFGLYGTIAGSLLYEHIKLDFDDSDIFTAPISRQIFSSNKRHLHEFNGNLDLAIGIRWDTVFCDSFAFGMQLGFEHHQYFNHSRLGTNRGDLSFDGGVFSISIGL